MRGDEQLEPEGSDRGDHRCAQHEEAAGKVGSPKEMYFSSFHFLKKEVGRADWTTRFVGRGGQEKDDLQDPAYHVQ